MASKQSNFSLAKLLACYSVQLCCSVFVVFNEPAVPIIFHSQIKPLRALAASSSVEVTGLWRCSQFHYVGVRSVGIFKGLPTKYCE